MQLQSLPKYSRLKETEVEDITDHIKATDDKTRRIRRVLSRSFAQNIKFYLIYYSYFDFKLQYTKTRTKM